MYLPKQGDIVYLDFNPQSGHEQAGRRPGLIVSNDEFFNHTKLAIVCPIMNTNNHFPLHIQLDDRIKTTGCVLTEHLKCLDIMSRNVQYVEQIPQDILSKVISYIHTFY